MKKIILIITIFISFGLVKDVWSATGYITGDLDPELLCDGTVIMFGGGGGQYCNGHLEEADLRWMGQCGPRYWSEEVKARRLAIYNNVPQCQAHPPVEIGTNTGSVYCKVTSDEAGTRETTTISHWDSSNTLTRCLRNVIDYGGALSWHACLGTERDCTYKSDMGVIVVDEWSDVHTITFDTEDVFFAETLEIGETMSNMPNIIVIHRGIQSDNTGTSDFRFEATIDGRRNGVTFSNISRYRDTDDLIVFNHNTTKRIKKFTIKNVTFRSEGSALVFRNRVDNSNMKETEVIIKDSTFIDVGKERGKPAIRVGEGWKIRLENVNFISEESEPDTLDVPVIETVGRAEVVVDEDCIFEDGRLSGVYTGIRDDLNPIPYTPPEKIGPEESEIEVRELYIQEDSTSPDEFDGRLILEKLTIIENFEGDRGTGGNEDNPISPTPHDSDPPDNNPYEGPYYDNEPEFTGPDDGGNENNDNGNNIGGNDTNGDDIGGTARAVDSAGGGCSLLKSRTFTADLFACGIISLIAFYFLRRRRT